MPLKLYKVWTFYAPLKLEVHLKSEVFKKIKSALQIEGND